MYVWVPWDVKDGGWSHHDQWREDLAYPSTMSEPCSTRKWERQWGERLNVVS
jgi:hypothetical protein